MTTEPEGHQTSIMTCIPKAECKDRQLYKIFSRNLTFGIYVAETGGFIGLREKFGNTYLFTEYHRDNGAPFGTVAPKKALAVMPAEIPLHEGDSVCARCLVDVTYDLWPAGGEREVIGLKSGMPIRVRGEWKHVRPSTCEDLDPIHRKNTALRSWLEAQMDEYYRGETLPKQLILHPGDDPQMGFSAARPDHTA